MKIYFAEEAIPRTLELWQNYPNPFNPSTEIKYGISQNSSVELAIFNILGQRIKTLVNKDQQPGFYVVRWNGEDEIGSFVSSGVYFMLLRAEGETVIRKLLLLK